jgi:pyruvate dehydrogenase E2 component (dihydrolipoamide acetyltransferase)
MALKNIALPELGEGVTEGELVKWTVKPGDKIQADQTIAEMMTDKATVEVPSPSGGVVKELKAKEGDVVEVGQVLITLESDGASAEPAKPAPAAALKPAAPVAAPSRAPAAAAAPTAIGQMSAAPAAAAAKPAGGAPASAPRNGMDVYPPPADAKVLATPATRRLAREMGVDVNGMTGTGVAGRVTREDVLGGGAGATVAGTPSYQAPSIPRPGYQSPAGAVEERVAIRGVRKKIAENMQMSKHIIPHFTLMDEANVTELVRMREELKAVAEKTGVKVTYLPFVMKALIATIRDFPMFNASIDDAKQEIVYKKYFNLGFAADTPTGLMVPVIKDAEHKTILQLSREILDLSKRAREGKLTLDEMKGATITITNIGSVGGTYATPIINHPEVAILGMYKIQDKPIVKKGTDGAIEIDVIKTMNYTITADHRLIDGAVAANFLRSFLNRIENPGVLMLDMM